MACTKKPDERENRRRDERTEGRMKAKQYAPPISLEIGDIINVLNIKILTVLNIKIYVRFVRRIRR